MFADVVTQGHQLMNVDPRHVPFYLKVVRSAPFLPHYDEHLQHRAPGTNATYVANVNLNSSGLCSH